MIYELRQYHLKPGCQERWVSLMENEVIPFQVARGMVILASFVGEADPEVYVWQRRFRDEEERVRLYEAVYQSDHWRTVIAPHIPELLDSEQVRVTRLVPTAKSPLQ